MTESTGRWSVALGLAGALLLAACGGGGGGAAPEPPPPSAADIAYATPDALYRAESPIADNTPSVSGGPASDFQVAPALPGGLLLDVDTGVIHGTPTAPASRRTYTVTATAAGGAVAGSVVIEVRWAAHKSLVAEADLDVDDLRHVLVRTQWGVTPSALADLQARGLPAVLADMFAFPAVGTPGFEQLAAQLLVNARDPAGQEGMFPTQGQLAGWWLQMMRENPNAFQEVLALVWHDHFATSSVVLDLGRTYYMKQHVDMLRARAAGNVRDLLVAVARDWAMLWWLNGVDSTKKNPNENFAREFFELFGLGVDNGYTQDDIVEASRAFTGYQDRVLDPDTGLRHVVFEPSRHDDTAKTLFGVTIPGQNTTDDYEAVVDTTIAERDVARWFALRLVQSFCLPEPDDVLVDQVAALLRDEGYEIQPTLTALLRSEAFFSPEARRAVVKSPVDYALGFMRSTGLVVPIGDLGESLFAQGNLPTLPPTVDGWPAGAQWLSAQAMVDRANLVQNAVSGARARTEQDARGVDVRDLLPPGTPTSAETVDALALRLDVELTAADRTRLIEYLDTERMGDGTVVPSPFDPNDPDHVEERVRGLLYVLGQHPTYMVR